MTAGKRTCRRHDHWRPETCDTCSAAMDHNARLYAGTTTRALDALMRTAPGYAR